MITIDNLNYSDNLKICLGPAADSFDNQYEIKEGCEIIDMNAFMDNKDIQFITFPHSLKVIESNAFNGCSNLCDINLKDTSLEIIKKDAFAYTYFTEILLPSTLRTISDRAFAYSRIEKLDLSHTNISKIDVLAFVQCHALEEIILPKTLKEFGDAPFEDCSRLVKINLEDTHVEYLPRNAFNFCISLKDIKLPPTLKNTDERVFARTKIESLSLPSSMTVLPEGFLIDSKVTNLYINGPIKAAGNFLKQSKLQNIYYLETDEKTSNLLNEIGKEYDINIIKEDISYLIDSNKSFKEINKTFKNLENINER